MLPKDANILFSFVNARLRDEYESFDELCAALDADGENVLKTLSGAGYVYSEAKNQFVPV